MTEEKRAELEQPYRNLNPVRLKAEIDEALERSWKLAGRPEEAKGKLAWG